MAKHNMHLSLRTTTELKNKLDKLAAQENTSKSKFLINRIDREYKYIQELKKVNDALCTIINISGILTGIIFDKNNIPFKEFDNENIIIYYNKITELIDGIKIPAAPSPKNNASKTKHISIRISNSTSRKLNVITDFYKCLTPQIVPLLLSSKRDMNIITILLECFCYISDIQNYFYEKHLINKEFEKEYSTLWEKML